MPPKLPNMKFRPKSDPRIKVEEDTVDPDDPEMMSLVQRERLRQLQIQADREQQVQRTTGGQVRPELGVGNSQSAGARSVKQEGGVRAPTARASQENQASSSGSAKGAAALHQQLAAIAAAQNTSAPPASHLPRDNMEHVLVDASSDELPYSVIRPIALNNARSVSGRNEMGKKQPSENLDPNAGVAFLEEWRAEAEDGRKQNRCFFGMETEAQSSSMSSVVQPSETDLVWMQLPRAAHGVDATKGSSAAANLSLKHMPAGRIGQLRVHKSGRCVLMLDNGLELEVSASSVARDARGMSQVAVATLPPMNAGEQPMAFELGPVISKMICTPNVVDK